MFIHFANLKQLFLFQGTPTLRLIACLLAVTCSVSSQRNGAHFHRHSDTELDSVQCHHAESWVTPEPSTGQESRLDPARQYLPAKPKEEEAPAATFQQPSFLTVEKTLVSPSTQKNYNSLFGNNKPEIVPSAAQNVPNALAPAAPRRTGDKKHSHEDDEDNLERLCNDAFHSFLCKPIKGPRKTPTGRLRANAVIPPEVLAGLSSFHNEARLRPETPKLQPAPKNLQSSFAKPSQYLPPIQPQPQRVLKPFTTTQRPTTPPAPFIDILKEENQEVPSPSNTDQLIIKPQAPHDCEKSKPTTPELPKPSYLKPVSLKPSYQTTQNPFGNPYNFKPNVPLPSNNVPKIARPFQPAPTHDCEKSKPLVPSPSYQNPIFNKPLFPTTTVKPYAFQYNIPIQSNNIPKTASAPQHDCEKTRATLPPVIANPSNNDPVSVKPYSPPTFKPFSNNFNSYTLNLQKSTLAPLKPTSVPAHDCEKQKLRASNTNQNPFFVKPNNPPTFKPIGFKSPENPKIPLPSNNIPQIIAQPQQIKSVTISPSAPTGYVYDRPAIPFPSNNNPSVAQTTTQSPFKQPNGYFYDQPKIPFPSNNIPQIVSKPTLKPSITQKPCEHDKPNPSPEESYPTNQDIVVLKPSSTSDSYVYDKPNIPFPPERTGPSNQIPVSLKPVTSTPNPTTGYYYDKPANPLLLPNPSNDFRNIAPSPASNGYNYQKPAEGFPSTTASSTSGYKYNKPNIPFPSSINSQLEDSSNDSPNFIAKPQSRVDVTVRPGYSYDKPNNPLLSPDSTNQNGYSYPKPASAFIR